MPSSVGLFSGIGGLELGMSQAGWQSELVCENDDGARAVLTEWFPEAELAGDIRKYRGLPKVDLVTAGFPCQDLSQAGKLRGIRGAQSGLVDDVFRLIGNPRARPRWVLLENVPFMLYLSGGRAMRYVTSRLENLGYCWAYRIIDTRAFGLPQRRKRVFILASRTEDPRPVLLGADAGERLPHVNGSPVPCGFYWTEGNRGVGWAVNAIPTLKPGSRRSIPSPPAIWFPGSGEIATPDIRDAERLQGFPKNWSRPATVVPRGERQRWRLVGNAVSVPVAEWIGRRLLLNPGRWDDAKDTRVGRAARWTAAGWGQRGQRFATEVSAWPVARKQQGLDEFLRFDAAPLSMGASNGFLLRARRAEAAGRLFFEEGFLVDLARHVRRMNTT